MVKPNVLVLTGYGINSDEETSFAFERARADSEIVHINDLIDGFKFLDDYQILAFPGGFSYGDDTGSGKALANKMNNHLKDELQEFIERDTLTIGICNGFQVMVNLGILPGKQRVALVHNDSARYIDRWVDLEFARNCVWTRGLSGMSLPIAHGEGKLYASQKNLGSLSVAARYVHGPICTYQDLEANPNGSLDDIAALTNDTGRVFGLMPHPERAIDFTHLPHWTLLKEKYKREGRQLPRNGPGLVVFENAVNYFD